MNMTLPPCLAAIVLLAGCASSQPAQPALAGVVAAEASLTAAGDIIIACYAVSSCAKVAPKAKIKLAYDAAYQSVTQAQTTADAGGAVDLTATTAAISALQALVATLPPS